MRRLTAAVAGLTLAIVLLACGGGDGGGAGGGSGAAPDAPTITIGTKNFTEQFILGELYAQALEAQGFEVDLKSDIGSSEIVDRALTAGSLDMYPEYTGVLLSEIAGEREKPRTAKETYEAAKAFQEKRGFTLLEMTPFSDSNALAVTPEFVREHDLRAIADLDDVPGGVTIAAPPEFRTRFEGLVGLRDLYDLDGVEVKPYKIGEQYEALDKGEVDAALVFTTDGRLVEKRYTLLRDPRNLFAFQNVAPVIKARLAERHPELVESINAVSAQLTTEAMREMNLAVQRGEEPAEVAERFLGENAPAAGG